MSCEKSFVQGQQCTNCSRCCPQFNAFIEGSSPVKEQSSKNYRKCFVTTTKYTTSTETSMKEKCTFKYSKVVEPLLNRDFDNSSETSHSSNLENEDMELNQTQNKSLSEDNEILRSVIPIGPRFQAQIPKWEDTRNVKCHNSDDLKWLGVQVWPMPNIRENKTEGIGEGRPDSYYYKNSGSVECVKLHLREAREVLKLEIGATFSSCRFDEMGEEVSELWTIEEDKKFESLLKSYTSSKARRFWKLAMKHFPSKSLKCLVNYYHNVYIPRCLSMETRSLHEADRDTDQDDNFKK